MTAPRLKRVRLGDASTLTRDLQGGPYLEINVFDSRTPAG